uniref:NADH dehydrogenase subunit 6 n=1 Tax=Panagrolaimus sp. JU765 TaxID=591449 RepID=A0AC34RHM0_9BILA
MAGFRLTLLFISFVLISCALSESLTENESEQLVRNKRAADGKEGPDDGKSFYRKYLQVYKFTSQDYPAMFLLTAGIVIVLTFAIFTSQDYPAMFLLTAGIVIVLTFAIVFIVVGLLTMDPGKDSIIYRMTTTRMKKD